VRSGYLIQNFKKAIIQNHNTRDNKDEIEGGRPCRAEIRWFGANHAGLRDVRGNVRMWGMKCEIERHAELSAMDVHRTKSPTEISMLALNERCDLKKVKRALSECVWY